MRIPPPMAVPPWLPQMVQMVGGEEVGRGCAGGMPVRLTQLPVHSNVYVRKPHSERQLVKLYLPPHLQWDRVYVSVCVRYSRRIYPTLSIRSFIVPVLPFLAHTIALDPATIAAPALRRRRMRCRGGSSDLCRAGPIVALRDAPVVTYRSCDPASPQLSGART